MTRRKKNVREDTLVDLVEVGEQAQGFFERNQRILSIGLGVLALVVGGFFAYKFLFQMPKEKEAANQMFQAEYQFSRDSFALALTSPGAGYEGFIDIIDNYSGTKAANVAHYYAGVSYLHLGQTEVAIDYLEDFKPVGKITPIMKAGVLGDAYSEIGNFDKAISQYQRAVAAGDNELLTAHYLMKLALLNEKQGNTDKAITLLEELQLKYPNTTEGANAEKYLARIN